jgi:acyl-coenzyme A synthetase/AMP-(fatty) acid ligase
MPNPIDDFFEGISRTAGPVLIDTTTPQRTSVSGAELTAWLDRLAWFLASSGVTSGDRVVAVFDNTLESALILLAAMRHGITLCVQPPDTDRADLAALEAALGAKTVVNGTRKSIERSLSVSTERLVSLDRVTPKRVPQAFPFTITFTSGSTGTPKGIVHSAESYLSCAAAFNRQTDITERDRFLNAMPMFYMAGIFNGVLAPLATGASVAIADAFTTTAAMRFWPTIAAEGITAAWLSPTMLSLVVRLDRTDKKLPASMRRLFIGTGALSSTDADHFHRTYGLVPQQSYGLSELLYVTVDDADSPDFGSVGMPLDGVRLAPDRNGPLSISTPFAFLGYWIDGDFHPHSGPFVTSDLAEVSERGTLVISGRSDDIIVRGGVNINPAEIESLLAPLLDGRRFCVSSIHDLALGQRVVLVTEGTRLSQADFVEAQMLIRRHPGRAQLDGQALLPSIPLGPTGKVRRAAVRTLLDPAQ